MKTKLFLTLMLLSAVVFSSTTQLKAEEPAAAQSAPESQDRPIKAIGVIIVNPDNDANVVLLTNIQIKGNPEPKLIAIPITLDENGKKLAAEYGITGMRPDVEGDEVRVREEAEKKSVYISGIVKTEGQNPMLEVKEFGSVQDLKNKQSAK